jgi:hypothetical protein
LATTGTVALVCDTKFSAIENSLQLKTKASTPALLQTALSQHRACRPARPQGRLLSSSV